MIVQTLYSECALVYDIQIHTYISQQPLLLLFNDIVYPVRALHIAENVLFDCKNICANFIEIAYFQLIWCWSDKGGIFRQQTRKCSIVVLILILSLFNLLYLYGFTTESMRLLKYRFIFAANKVWTPIRWLTFPKLETFVKYWTHGENQFTLKWAHFLNCFAKSIQHPDICEFVL